jgi:hypothetical protein
VLTRGQHSQRVVERRESLHGPNAMKGSSVVCVRGPKSCCYCMCQMQVNWYKLKNMSECFYAQFTTTCIILLSVVDKCVVLQVRICRTTDFFAKGGFVKI